MRSEVVLRIVASNVEGLAGRQVTVTGWPAFVGRSDDCVLSIADPRVSRRHARLELEEKGLRIFDAGSANGIWMDEARVEDAWLGHETRFRIADTVVEIIAPHVPAPPEAPRPEQTEKTIVEARTSFVVRIVRSPGAQDGKEFPIEGGGATIGRAADCSVVLRDDGSSRHHARIDLVNGGSFHLLDLGSANGVWVGDEKVSERRIAAGERFRIGDTYLECEVVRQAADRTPTRIIADYADLMQKVAARRLEDAGEAVALGGHKVILLADPTSAYYIASGRVEIFTVTVRDGEPVGTRTHFLTANEGELFFGFDITGVAGSGFLATGRAGTQVRRVPLTDLRTLLDDSHSVTLIGRLVDQWIAALSQRLVRDISPLPPIDLKLSSGQAHQAPGGAKASMADGVGWVELSGAPLLYVSMSSLVPAEGRRGLFPVTASTWIEPEVGITGPVPLRVRETADNLLDDALWEGLQHFHAVLCECEFINKRLAIVDEFERLRVKARQSEAARDAAYDAIGQVLAGRTPQGSIGETSRMEPLLEAARLITEELGIAFEPPTLTGQETAFEDQLAAVAAACHTRVRQVALRDDWWRRDQGPILGRVESTGAPVALLPRGPRAYEYVDPAAGTRGPVGPDEAATLKAFGFSFYRPLPAGQTTLRDLLRFGFRGVKADPSMVLAVGILSGLLGMMTPFLTGQIVDSAIPQGDRGLLLQFAGGMFLVAAATGALKVVQSFAVVRIETKLDYTLQSSVWDRILDLPAVFFRKFVAGDLADRAMGINTIRGLVARAGVSGLLNAVSSFTSIALMTYYSWKLALVGLLVTFVLVGTTGLANLLQLRYQREESTIKGRVAGLVLQLIAGVAKVRVTAAENHAFKVWAEQFAGQKIVAFRAGRIQNVVEALSSSFPLLSSLVLFGVLYYLKVTAKPGAEFDISTGDFIAFNTAYGNFTQGIQTLAESSLTLLKAIPIYERLRPILDAAPEIEKAKAHPRKLAGEITASRASFRYTEDGPLILNDVSFRIKAGEFVAIAGPSGCGKSTLLRLLLGFEAPSVGTLNYDGQDLNSLDVRAVRQQIGVVLQDSRLLPTDLYRNIAGSASRTIEDAWEAAEMAGLADDIRQMPMGMHTVVSEGGGTFSGGQKQRLLIARALVNKPKIIFFDEATSALDNRTQAVVTQSLDRMDATRIVIAHRLSTIVGADRILYFEGGQVKEDGTYDELMAKNGLFADLARRQIA